MYTRIHNTPYVCNIDLSKPQQVHGVTNLADVPIIEARPVDSVGGPSALDGFQPQRSSLGQQPKRHWVDSKLNLNLA